MGDRERLLYGLKLFFRILYWLFNCICCVRLFIWVCGVVLLTVLVLLVLLSLILDSSSWVFV